MEQDQPSRTTPAKPSRKTRRPAEMFHPSVFILEEMKARSWTPDLLIGDGEDLARAFGTSAEFWRMLEAGWREWKRGRAK